MCICFSLEKKYMDSFTKLFLKSDWNVCVCVLVTKSCPTLWNPMDYIAFQAPLPMELSR